MKIETYQQKLLCENKRNDFELCNIEKINWSEKTIL